MWRILLGFVLVSACKEQAAAGSPQVDNGAALYTKYCALCHGKDATGYAADNAPSLVNPTFLASAGDDFLRHAIKLGRPGTAMGGYAIERGGPLAERDITAVIAFLRSHAAAPHMPLLDRPARGNAEKGAAIWQRECRSCHGDQTARGEAIHLANPQLISTARDAFLRFAIENGRPGTRMPSFSAKLGAEGIEDVVTHLRSWDPRRIPAPAPASLPVVPPNLPRMRSPKGPTPRFTLRDDRFVPAAEVKQALDAKSRIIVLDARAVPDWLDARIPGALPTPYYDFRYLDDLPKDGTWIIAYCACPHHASGAVVDELRRRGYKNTAILDEGILFWRQKGYPIETGAAK